MFFVLLYLFQIFLTNFANNVLLSTIMSNFVTNILSFILSPVKSYSILYDTLWMIKCRC